MKILRCICCVLCVSYLPACAELKDTGRTIGHGTKNVATAIGHASRDAAKSISKNTKKVISEMNDENKK